MPPISGCLLRVFSLFPPALKKKRYRVPSSLILHQHQHPQQQQLLVLLLLLVGSCILPTAAPVKMSEAAEFGRTLTETAPYDDFESKHERESIEVSPERALVIGLSQAPHTAKSTQGAVASASGPGGLFAAAPGLAAAAVAENIRVPSTGRPYGAWPGKTLLGNSKQPKKWGASIAATSAVLLLLLVASSVTTLARLQAEAKPAATEAARGAAAIAATGTKAAELDAATLEASAEAAAEEAAAEAAAAAPWSLEATKADAKWLARRLNTNKCDAAVEKIVKALSEIRLSEREHQQQPQVEDVDTLRGAPEIRFEGPVTAIEDLLDGLNVLLAETRAHLRSEVAAAERERTSFMKAQLPLRALTEEAPKVLPAASEISLEGYILGADLTSDALEKNALRLNALGRELLLEVKRLRAAAANRPTLLLKSAIVAVKEADEIQAQSRRLLEEGLQWCTRGERAALLFAKQTFLESKVDFLFLRQKALLKMFDVKSSPSAALLTAHKNLVCAASRMQESSLLIQKIEEILNRTKNPSLAIDEVQTAGSLVDPHCEVTTASALLATAKGYAKAEASAAEEGEQQNAAETAVSSATIPAGEHQQEQQKEASEEGRQETEELRAILSSFVNRFISLESRNVLFLLGTPPQRANSSLLPFPSPSQKHFELWKEARENAELVLDQVREAAEQNPAQMTRQSPRAALSKLHELAGTFRRHARKGVDEFHLYETWLQAETFLAEALEERKSSLRTLAALQGKPAKLFKSKGQSLKHKLASARRTDLAARIAGAPAAGAADTRATAVPAKIYIEAPAAYSRGVAEVTKTVAAEAMLQQQEQPSAANRSSDEFAALHKDSLSRVVWSGLDG
ncbi:hypothetical protein Esti_006391 [Eimeria stiedai]